nr:unnamed protein product [Callosobruchus chinensis]
MSQCKKFSPNIFHKTKCSNCFRQKEEHSAEALECNRIAGLIYSTTKSLKLKNKLSGLCFQHTHSRKQFDRCEIAFFPVDWPKAEMENNRDVSSADA